MSQGSEPDSEPVFDWLPYYKAVAAQPVSPTLARALALPDLYQSGRDNRAVDLGCGEGRDSLELLSAGWTVVAVDNFHAGITRLQELAGQRNLAERLQVIEESFVTADWGTVDLVSAHLALPYCPPAQFASLWERIVKSLRDGGVLTTQLFGERHSGAKLLYVSHVTRTQVDELLKEFDVLKLEEIETTGKWASGEAATVHEYQILARKKRSSAAG